MNRKHLDQALAQLADALESQNSGTVEVNPLELVGKIPDRAISGDKINGGKIVNFTSAGIQDNAKKTQLTLSESGVNIERLKVGIISQDLHVEGTIKADTLEVKHLNTDIQFDKKTSIEFDGHSKGIIWKGSGSTKQFILTDRDTFFSSESIDIHNGKHYAINGVKILDESELGGTVTKSNLRELGRLKGLVVHGHVNINDYFFYNASSDRIGLGTEEPKAALTVAEDMIEVSLGTRDETKGFVGTHQNHSFNIVTGDVERINISANGNITLGNTKLPPVQVGVHGKLAVRVPMPDPEVDLHVNGAIKYSGHSHRYDKNSPTAGSYNKGDIVWNTEPKVEGYIGWVCVIAGAPGTWVPFGKIGI